MRAVYIRTISLFLEFICSRCFFSQLKPQYSVCDLTAGRSDSAVHKEDSSPQVENAQQEQMSSARPGSLFEFAWCWLWGMKERENPQDVVGQGLLLNACAGLLRACNLESRHRFSRPNLPQDFFFNQLNASADQILNW